MTAEVCTCCNLAKPTTVALHARHDIVLCSDCLDWLVRRRDQQLAGSARVRVVGTEPILFVSDVARALDHYERLGFTTDSHDESYAFAHRDDLTIHLVLAEGRPTAGPCTCM